MGLWEGWGWLSGRVLQVWVQHRGFFPVTLAGMLQALQDNNIQGSRRGVRQSFHWGLQ